MIVTKLYKGQGFGNQLWVYITTRCIAEYKGYEFGIESPDNFKGSDFMNIDFGKEVFGGKGLDGKKPISLPKEIKHYYLEKRINHPNGSDIRIADKSLYNIPNNTKIDGCMQDFEYIKNKKEEIRKWLEIKKEYDCYDFSDDNICIINFRGTGYVVDRDLYLTKKYWRDAIKNMLKINKNLKFVVITEDIKNAKKYFPDFEVYHFSIAKDYSIIKNAKYLILSNSSFAWFPAWLNEDLKYCIAPKYWARHNISDGYWSLSYNITENWMYQDRLGSLHDYQSCLKEFSSYKENNKVLYLNNSPSRTSFLNKIKNNFFIFKAYKNETSTIPAITSIISLIIPKIYFSIKSNTRKIIIQIIKNKITKRIKYSIKKFLYSFEIIFKKTKWRINEYKAKKDWLSEEEIKKYRKKIKVYDAFNFFNELELLEIRLNILDNYVDYFVIVESTLTHSGKPKELHYQNNKHLFKKFEHKIIYYVIDNPLKNFRDAKERLNDPIISEVEKTILRFALSSDNIQPGSNEFLRDFYEKECVKIPLLNLSDNDFCFVSDLDEIWNPEILIDYSKNDIFKPLLDNYVYYLNNRSNELEGGTGTIATKYKNIKNSCLNHLRTRNKTKYTRLSNGGWHFTFQGQSNMIRKKLESYSYQGDENTEARKKIKEAIENNKDIFGRYYKFWKDEKKLPKYILNNKQKYKHLIK